MMETWQSKFFKKIEDIIPNNHSLVNEIVELLDISIDSAYRRLRGQTQLSIDEVIILCNHYKISFDSFINLESGHVSFNYTLMEYGLKSFSDYHDSLLKDMAIIRKTRNKQIVYASEDIPVFHHFNIEGISKFKIFYWLKSILNAPEFEDEKYSPEKIPQSFIEKAKEIYKHYCNIPSIELWTDTTIQSTLKQIEFYFEAGMFESNEIAIEVLKSLREELEIIQNQATQSSKCQVPGILPENENNYELYFSEIEITNNCVYVNLGETQAVYLGHLSFNTMSTSNKKYCEETKLWLENLKRKSTLISGVSEKIRYQFFKRAFKGVDELIQKITND